MTSAVIYTRTSTSDQELGHLAQEAECRAHAEAQGLKVLAIYTDTCSGTIAPYDREGFGQMLDHLSGEIVLMNRRDRLGRDVVNNAVTERMLDKAGSTLITLDTRNGDNPEDVFTKTLIDAIAQYERAIISRRTKQALKAKRAQGLVSGTPALGYKATEKGELVVDEQERQKIDRVRDLRAEGYTYTQLIKICEREGIQTRQGSTPSVATLSRWCKGVKLERPIKAGKRKGSNAGRPQLRDTLPQLTSTIVDLKTLGHTHRKISQILTERGYTTSKGGVISHTQVGRVLRAHFEKIFEGQR
jgi:DNA invertase Pin-like site-specific DNA recombinase